MKSYLTYLFKTKFLSVLKYFSFKILPIIISVLALFFAYKGYQRTKTEADKKDIPTWSYTVDIIDTSFILQKITFESTSPEIVLQNLVISFTHIL